MLVLTGFAAFAATPASAQTGFSFTRLAGTDRYGTAAAIATNSFPTGSDNVLLASGQNFPDALAGNYLAGNKAAPLLLTTTAALPQVTKDALATLKAKTVTILGGTSAVSTAVENAVKAAGYTVVRIGGLDRYATAKLISETPPASNVGTTAGAKTAILASGQNFADALTAGPLGYAQQFPVEITDPATLSADTKAAFTDLAIKNVIIAGGTAAVSSAVEAQVTALGITVTRLAGTTRQLTAVKIADYEVANAGFSLAHVNLARGDDFADALSGGPHAGKEKAPILLTDATCTLGAAAQKYLTDHASTLTSGHIFGGTAAVCDAVKTAAEGFAGGGAGVGGNGIANTAAPQLVSAAIQFTIPVGQTTTAQEHQNPGTIVRYTFNKPITSANPKLFLAYPYNWDSSAFDACSGIGTAASPLPFPASGTPKLLGCSSFVQADGLSVDILFPSIRTAASAGAPAGTNPGTVADNYTLATVQHNAVTNSTGLTNAEGSAAIGTARPIPASQFANNTTTAPDLKTVTFGTATAFATPNQTPVTFTFDQAAFAQPGALAAAPVVSAPGTGPNGTTPGFFLVYPDNSEVKCAAGPFTTTNGSPAATVPTGGDGTTSVTVLCPNSTTAPTSTTLLTTTSVARAYVGTGTVASAALTGTQACQTPATTSQPGTVTGTPSGTGTASASITCNPLEAVHLSQSATAGTTAPDLLTVTAQPAGTTTNNTPADAVLYTFDQNLDSAQPTSFGLNLGDAAQQFATGGSCNPFGSSAVTTAAGGSGCTINGKNVVVYFPAGSLTPVGTAPAVGAFAIQAAVTSTASIGNPSQPNQADELGITPPVASNGQITPGVVDGPQLTGVTVGTVNVGAGPQTGATYTFNAPIVYNGNANLFRLYLQDGSELEATGCTSNGTATLANTTKTVTCTSYVFFNGTTFVLGQPSQITASTLGTVVQDAVTGSVSGVNNPEGAAPTVATA